MPGPIIACSPRAPGSPKQSSKRRAPASSRASRPRSTNHILIIDWFYVDGLEGGWLGPKAFANREPCATVADLAREQAAVDRRLIALCEALTEASLGDTVRINRDTRVQTERRDRLLLHLFQHQVHHRGQAHAMLSDTRVKPPQLDEFFSVGEAPLRAAEFAALGWTEDTVWGNDKPASA
jgi:uncharacterized damage-inducible protein DinB